MSHSHEKQPDRSGLKKAGAAAAGALLTLGAVTGVAQARNHELVRELTDTAAVSTPAPEAANAPNSSGESQRKNREAVRTHNLQKAASIVVSKQTVPIETPHTTVSRVATVTKSAPSAIPNVAQNPAQQEAASNGQVAELLKENAVIKAANLSDELNGSIPTNTMLKNVLYLIGTIQKQDANGHAVPYVENAFYLSGSSETPTDETAVQFQEDAKTAWFGYLEHNTDGSVTVVPFQLDDSMSYATVAGKQVGSGDVYMTQVTLANRQPADCPYVEGTQISPGFVVNGKVQ